MADVLPNTESIRVSFGLYNTATEEFQTYTEQYIADVLPDCSNYNILITWLNNLGSWEYWLFQGNTTYGYDIEDSQEAERSTFENWDSNFTQAETERFYAEVKARVERTIRANALTQEQAQSLGTILYSIAAQEFLPEGGKRTVLVEKSGKAIRTEQEKLIDLEFDIRNSERLPVQRQ